MPKSSDKKRKSKKGGFELAPLAAAGILYATAASNKKGRGRKMKGGDTVVSSAVGMSSGAVTANSMIPMDVRRESPAMAAVTGSAANSPLVTGTLGATKGDYIGATAASRPAPVSAPGGLLEGGGKKKRRSRKYKGGEGCEAMANPVNMGAGGDVRLSPVVAGAVGGVANQEENAVAQDGGAKKRRKSRKQRGGDDSVPSVEGGEPMPQPPVVGEGGMPSENNVEQMPPVSQEGGKTRKRRSKKRGGEGVPVPPTPEQQAGVSTTPETPLQTNIPGGEANAEKTIANFAGGAKKRKSKAKKHGGADVEAFNADAEDHADALGGFNKLLADVEKQVGGKAKKSKKKGGAFKLYAKELTSLSKKLKKLM